MTDLQSQFQIRKTLFSPVSTQKQKLFPYYKNSNKAQYKSHFDLSELSQQHFQQFSKYSKINNLTTINAIVFI